MSRNQGKEQGNKGREDKGHGGGTKNDWCLKETARILYLCERTFEKEKLAMRQAFDFDAEKAEALSEQRPSFDKEKAKALSEQQLLVDFDKEMKAALSSLRCFAGRQVLTTGLQRVRTGRLRQLGRPGAPHGERQDPFLPRLSALVLGFAPTTPTRRSEHQRSLMLFLPVPLNIFAPVLDK